MVTKFLKDGLNTVVDEVTSGFNIDLNTIFPTNTLESGAPRKFPKDLDSKEFGSLKIEFAAYELQGLRLSEKLGGGIKDTAQNILGGIQSGLQADGALKQINQISERVTTAIENAAGGLFDGVKRAGGEVWDTVKNVWDRDANTAESLSIAAAKGLIERGKWQLFIPQNISTSYSANWQRSELNFLGQALESATKGGLSSLPGGQAIGDTAKLMNGEAINPMSELLFNGIDHRSFSFNFTLYPKNAEETQLLKDLIYFFKCNMTPELSPNTGNLVMRYPNYFKIRYLFNNVDNPWLNKIAYCALTRFNVAYQANLPAFHRDGSPVAATISMEFQEIEPIYRQFIAQGY